MEIQSVLLIHDFTFIMSSLTMVYEKLIDNASLYFSSHVCTHTGIHRTIPFHFCVVYIHSEYAVQRKKCIIAKPIHKKLIVPE